MTTTPAEYLDLGWHLLPIELESKRPLAGQGLHHATQDTRKISEWARMGCDWAAAAEASGFVVIDVDPRNGGDATWAELLEQRSELPPHPVQFTRNGGEHHLFHDTGAKLLGKLGEGIDLKRAGYILVVPSPGYQWDVSPWDVSLPDLPPDWLEACVKGGPKPATVHAPAQKDRPRIGDHSRYGARAVDAELQAVRGEGEGGRNRRLNQAAVALASLAAGGEVDESTARCDLRQAGIDAGLGEQEVDATIRSGWNYGITTPRSAPPRLALAPKWEDAPPPTDEDAPPEIHHADAGTIDIGPAPPVAGTDRPAIRIGVEIKRVVDDAEAAILAMPRRNLYQRAGALVRVARDAEPAAKGEVRPPGALSIQRAGPPYLTEMCSRAATWWRYDARAKKDDEPWKPAMPPGWVAATLTERGQWSIPPLLGLIASPTLRPDGSVLSKPGYDYPTGLLYLPGGTNYPEVPSNPTRDDARDALLRLCEPFHDFPFVAECDRAAAISAVLSLVCRAAIDGPVPMYTVRATTAGTGKTLLADVVSIIGTGHVAPKFVQSTTADEERKRLLAVAMEGDPVLCIDNVDRALGTGPLDSAITAGVVKDRILGMSCTGEAPFRAVVIATGNNLVVRGDTGRRVVPIDLDANCESPELRQGWKHPNLMAWVARHRGELVRDALTVCRAHALAGWPLGGAVPLGTFEGWSAVARCALLWCGMADPCDGRERIKQDSDSSLDGLRTLLQAWRECYGDAPMLLRQVAESTSEPYGDPAKAMKDAVDDVTATYKRGTVQGKLGYYLRRHRGRVVDGLRIDSLPKEGSGVPWVVLLQE